MSLALPFPAIADHLADLLRRLADAISPPREQAAPAAAAEPAAEAYDADGDRAVLAAAFRDRLSPHLRRDLGIDS